LTISRIVPWMGTGTGDDSHECGMCILPLYYTRNVLQHLRLNPRSNPKVVGDKELRKTVIDAEAGD
jgi:hypothetical protein